MKTYAVVRTKTNPVNSKTSSTIIKAGMTLEAAEKEMEDQKKLSKLFGDTISHKIVSSRQAV